MNNPLPAAPISPLRQRLIDDMNMRRFSRRDPAQLHPRRRALRHVSGALAGHGHGGGSAPLPGRAARGWRSRADDEQHRLGAAVLLHAHARPARPRAQAGPGDASAQAAGGAEPRRGRPPAERDDLPQAPGGAVGRLWRRPARRRGLDPQGQRHRQRAHAAQGRTRQRRAVSQRHALGGYARPAAPVVEGRPATRRDAPQGLAVSRPACRQANQHPAVAPDRRRGGARGGHRQAGWDRIRCATASPRICWRTASTSASSRRCSATPSWTTPPSTPRWRRGRCAP